MRREIGQHQTGHKKQCRQYGGSTTQKVGRSRRPEQTAGRPTAERSAHIRPFALLQQHQDDDGHRKQQMQNQY